MSSVCSGHRALGAKRYRLNVFVRGLTKACYDDSKVPEHPIKRGSRDLSRSIRADHSLGKTLRGRTVSKYAPIRDGPVENGSEDKSSGFSVGLQLRLGGLGESIEV